MDQTPTKEQTNNAPVEPPVKIQPAQPLQQLSQPSPGYGHTITALRWIIFFVAVFLLIMVALYFFYHQMLFKSQPVATNLVPTPTMAKLSPSPVDQTANWKTYTNAQYGFSIQYPNSWSVVEYSDTIQGANNTFTGTTIVFGDPTQKLGNGRMYPYASITTFTHDKVLSTPADTMLDEFVHSGKITWQKIAIGNNIQAEKTQIPCQSVCTEIVFKNQKTFYDFSYGQSFTANGDYQYQKEYDEMLKTFKLTDPTQTTDTTWKTYTDLNTSFKYPSDWTYTSPASAGPSDLQFTPANATKADLDNFAYFINVSLYANDYTTVVNKNPLLFNQATQKEQISVNGVPGVHYFNNVGGAYILQAPNGKALEFDYNIINGHDYGQEAKQMMDSLVVIVGQG